MSEYDPSTFWPADQMVRCGNGEVLLLGEAAMEVAFQPLLGPL